MTSCKPFPVLCGRRRAEGAAGEAKFAELADLGDLLDFEPVPRRIARADGWTPEVQRAFAVTGSDRQACASRRPSPVRGRPAPQGRRQ